MKSCTNGHTVSLVEIKDELERYCSNAKLKESYWHAIRWQGDSSMQMLATISRILKTDMNEYLILNGKQPSDFSEIITKEFDFGNEIGVGIKLETIKELQEIPLGHRILLMLWKRNKEIQVENNKLTLALRILRPHWLTRLINLFIKRKQ